MTPYEFALNNVKTYIRSKENQPNARRDVPPMNAFDATQVLAVAFMKPQNEVMADMLAPIA